CQPYVHPFPVKKSGSGQFQNYGRIHSPQLYLPMESHIHKSNSKGE
ncbi:MAG: hypothetical protein ACI943_002165, partial [Gammaproteobacteria bacterium]